MFFDPAAVTCIAPVALPAGVDRLPVSIDILGVIFERVLQFSPIEAESNFFELGGDSIMATALALEVEAELGIKIPVSILFDAPTPTALARAIGRLAPRRGSMMLLKPGGSCPPLFLAPGAGGLPFTIASLAKRMDVPGSIYGFQAPGLNAAEPALSRIEEMALHYLPSIRAVQPHGPYLLGGYSMGGLTALELAQMLVRSGERVDLLAMFDTYITPRRLCWRSKLAVWRRRASHHAAQLKGMNRRALVPFALGRCRSLLSDLGIAPKPPQGLPRPDDTRFTPAMRRVTACGLAASVAYRPQFYPGTITYFQARDSESLPGYPDLTWRRLARKLTVHVVNGDHREMMRGHCADAAQQFSQCVRAALAAHQA